MPDSFVALAARLRHDVDAILSAPVLGGADDPLDAVAASARLQKGVADLVAASVQRARDEGRTWSQIGDVLGVSRQAAFQRFGRPIDPRTGEPMNTTPLPAAAQLAAEVVDDLAHSRWGSVVARFDDVMADRLDVDGLAAAWAQLVATAGRYESSGRTEATRAADFTITNTPLAFEAGDFTARITFRDDATVAGLFILNPEATV